MLKAHISEAIVKWKLLRTFLCPPIVKWKPLNYLKGLRKTHFCWQIFSYFRNIQHLFSLECEMWAKAYWAVVILKHANVYDKRAVQSVTLSFSIFPFFPNLRTFVKILWANPSVLKEIFEVLARFYYITKSCNLGILHSKMTTLWIFFEDYSKTRLFFFNILILII